MPTTPPPHLLDRDLSKAEARELLGVIDPLFHEVINHGVALFARCVNGDLKPDVDLVVLLAYLHLIEMADATHVLLSQVAPVPARLQLRSMFEALLALDYMLEKDTERRARAHQYDRLRRELIAHRFFDPQTAEGGAARERQARDAVGRATPLPPLDRVRKEIRELQTALAEPRWEEVRVEFSRLKKERRRQPRWYSLFGGPWTLEELADTVHRGYLYDRLYREWSSTAHVEDLKRRVIQAGENRAAIRGLRRPDDLRSTTVAGIGMMLNAARRVIQHYCSDEVPAFQRWYAEEIQGPFMSLARDIGSGRSDPLP